MAGSVDRSLFILEAARAERCGGGRWALEQRWAGLEAGRKGAEVEKIWGLRPPLSLG